MSQLTLDTHVCDIVTALPQSADLFRSLRIDFCCGGKISLKDAAKERELKPEEVLNSINEIEDKRKKQGGIDPTTFGSKTLVTYIQEKYHEGLREEFAVTCALHYESCPCSWRKASASSACPRNLR
ncbi:DUF542 domain-containing protein [Sporosarcina sp. JAI121]|uniref:DUF542 domain-containing protein n=1 Tax=Sporosarcina sp. JAI121 TaxID=2723064 RepID=UPI00184D6EA0|nr:iron-sulfur cluster repair protein YtfE (RIC family) [Sporosarcina sp. JAI121]